MKNTEITQNWYSYVGFEGKKENGFICPEGKETVATDYVELRIDPKEGSPLYSVIEYTEEEWMKDHPGATPFIEKDGKYHGDYSDKGYAWTMKESVDRIVAYVHFTHETNEFNTIFFEVGSSESRDDVELKSYLTDEEFKEIIDFAENCMRNDFLKLTANARWDYADDAEELGLVDVEENAPRKWKNFKRAFDITSLCEHVPFEMVDCSNIACARKLKALCKCYTNPLNCSTFCYRNKKTLESLGIFVCDDDTTASSESIELTLPDIIANMRDELERAYELLKDNEDAKEEMLLSDIEASLERSIEYLSDDTSLMDSPGKKLFRYYWYDSNRCERTVGLVYAMDQENARKNLKKKYPSVMPMVWDISEVSFSEDGSIEVHYGC